MITVYLPNGSIIKYPTGKYMEQYGSQTSIFTKCGGKLLAVIQASAGAILDCGSAGKLITQPKSPGAKA